MLSQPTTAMSSGTTSPASRNAAIAPIARRSLAVLGLLVPFFTYMIPLYFQFRSMGLLDTLLGADLVLASTSISFGTFFMRAFFTDLPSELEHAARVDGCSEAQIFLRVMLPLVSSWDGRTRRVHLPGQLEQLPHPPAVPGWPSRSGP